MQKEKKLTSADLIQHLASVSRIDLDSLARCFINTIAEKFQLNDSVALTTLIDHAANTEIELIPHKLNLERFWHLNEKNDFHAFHSSALPWWGFPLLETQTAKLLKFLLIEGEEELQRDRVGNFLSALDSKWVGHKAISDMKDIVVEVERVIEENRRIDLIVEWHAAGKKFAVIIEIKVGADLHGDQMSYYEKYVLKQRYEDKSLIVLAPNILKRSFDGLKKWKRVSWVQLLRNWEATSSHSCECNPYNNDFAMAKKTLWRDCT